MNKVVGVLTALAIIASSAAFAQQQQIEEPVKESFFYGALGVGPLPVPLPIFGLGYRMQTDHYGADISLDVSSLYVISYLKFTPSFNYYSTPNLDSQFYTGIGLSASLVNPRNGYLVPKTTVTLSPQLTFGKKYRNEVGADRFFQVMTNWPTFAFDAFQTPYAQNHMIWVPLVTIKYGVIF